MNLADLQPHLAPYAWSAKNQRKFNQRRGIMGIEDIFTFGKHIGEQLEDVIEDDPDYIGWLAGNDFNFDEETLELLSKKGIA